MELELVLSQFKPKQRNLCPKLGYVLTGYSELTADDIEWVRPIMVGDVSGGEKLKN
jgi:hypothetical protein